MNANTELINLFEKNFNCKAEYIVRCPGRVNLIGEHTDYSGYGVLPMAIEASTYLIISKRPTKEIEFRNTNSSYNTFIYNVTDTWKTISKPEWYHYLLSGLRGLVEKLDQPLIGMNILLSGNIPPNAGLSSSSSLVCSAAMASLALLSESENFFDKINRVELAELTAKAERYVGMEGGGMDQAIEILANEGNALMINFNPLSWESVVLPETAHFAVIHSGITLNKAATSQYNERVVECRTAAQIIAKIKGIVEWQKVRKLKDLADLLDKKPSEMIKIVDEILVKCLYNKSDILEILDLSDDEFKASILSANTQNMELFKLSQRARHVFSEAFRVSQFRDACLKSDVQQLGSLMNESHQSCKEDYECSCTELDETVKKCLEAGALGARLTGAGWGGCVVALFTNRNSKLDVLFWSRPSSGLTINKI